MSKERLGFDLEREMKHLKKIVDKDDRLTISSRFMKYFIEQAEQNQRYKRTLDEIYNHAINFSYVEDLDVKNYDLFEFASRVSFIAQKSLEGESE